MISASCHRFVVRRLSPSYTALPVRFEFASLSNANGSHLGCRSMHVLALETSTRQPTFALADEDRLLVEWQQASHQTTAADLLPAIQGHLQQLRWQPGDVGLVGVSIGPGSFSGLRVGLTVAKTWGHLTGAVLIAIDTFHVLAQQVAPAPLVSVLIPAQRGQVFASLLKWSIERGEYQPMVEPTWWDPLAWLKETPPETIHTGPGVSLLQQAAGERLRLADASVRFPRARTVAQLAWHRYQRGHRDDPMLVVPRYLRPSAAEERRSE